MVHILTGPCGLRLEHAPAGSMHFCDATFTYFINLFCLQSNWCTKIMTDHMTAWLIHAIHSMLSQSIAVHKALIVIKNNLSLKFGRLSSIFSHDKHIQNIETKSNCILSANDGRRFMDIETNRKRIHLTFCSERLKYM